MLFDKQNLFSDAQAITSAAPSTNVIDLGAPGKTWHGQTVEADVGKGEAKDIRIQVVETISGGTITALTVDVQVDNDEAFGSPKVVASSGPIPVADLVAGKVLNPIYLPRGMDERYVRLNYTPATGSAGAGALTAGIVASAQDNV